MKYCPKCQRPYAVSQSVCADDGETLLLKDLYGLTGRVVSDKYRIESLVTIGGMSAVYRARQIGVERQVAFKILLPNLAVNDQNMLTLFEREARTAGRLTHENIATVHDAGRTHDELAYIVMEWLEGKTLEEEFNATEQMSYKRMLHLLRQIAAALDTAHAQGVIHRDLKPANIMILPRGPRGGRAAQGAHADEGRDLVKVLDFGLAKVTSESTDLQVSSALGTPHYASPEQFRIGEEIDGRSDVYSLGVILYRMLTGALPFEATSVHGLIRLHLLETPPPLRNRRPDAPTEVEYLVNRMLAKTPHYRPATAGEAIEAFEAALRESFTSGELFATSGNHTNATTNANAQSGTPGQQPARLAGTGNSTSGDYDSLTGQTPAQAFTSGPHTPTSGQYAHTSGQHTPTSGNHSNAAVASVPASSSTHVSVGAAFTTVPTAGATFMSVNAANGSNASSVTSNTTNNLSALGGGLNTRVLAAQAIKAAKDPKKAAFVLVCAAAIAVACFFLISKNRAPLPEKELILLGDIVNTTGDAVFDKTLRPALAAQLSQTASLSLLAEDKVRETLAFMNRKPDEPLTREVAREVALRRGLKATLIGQLDKLDRHYSLAFELINTQTGETLRRALAEADGKDKVLNALSQTAQKMRDELGATLAAVPKFNAPTEQVTTASLDALKAYTLGGEELFRKANLFDALPLYQRAVELDPHFAMAEHALATLYTENGLARLAAEHAQKAYDLRDKISERERLAVTALYHNIVTGDARQVVETYKLLGQTYPNDARAHTGLAGAHLRMAKLEPALSEAEAALRLEPNDLAAHGLRAAALIRLNRVDEAKQKLEQALAQNLDGMSLRAALLEIAFLQGNGELLKAQIDWARAHHREDQALAWQAAVAAANGGVKQAAAYLRQAMDLNQQRGQKELSAAYGLNAAVWLAVVGLNDDARKLLDEAQTLAPDAFTSFALTTPLPFGPFSYALSANADKAKTLGGELSKRQPQNLLANSVWLPLTQAVLAVQGGKAEEALELLKQPAAYEIGTQHFYNWVRGTALLKLNRGQEAVAEFQKITANRQLEPLSMFYPLARLGLARAYNAQGDRPQARLAYRDLFTLWKGAEAELPPLTEAKNEMAELKFEVPTK